MCSTLHLFHCALLLWPLGQTADAGFGELIAADIPPGVAAPATATNTIDLELLRPASPLVRLRGFTAGVPGAMGELTSADLPRIWTRIPYDRLEVVVDVLADTLDDNTLGYIELLLDGAPLHNSPRLQSTDPPTPRPDGRYLVSYRYQLPCPAPGKHLLQARYLKAGLWSRLSPPLRFQVDVPRTPVIVAVAERGCPPAKLAAGRRFELTTDELVLKVAEVVPGTELVADLDGRTIKCASLNGDCCYSLRLTGQVEPGVHALSVRAVTGAGCAITSAASDRLYVHYNVRDHYMLGLEPCAPNRLKDREPACDCPRTRPMASDDLPGSPLPGNPLPGNFLQPNPLFAPQSPAEIILPAQPGLQPGLQPGSQPAPHPGHQPAQPGRAATPAVLPAPPLPPNPLHAPRQGARHRRGDNEFQLVSLIVQMSPSDQARQWSDDATTFAREVTTLLARSQQDATRVGQLVDAMLTAVDDADSNLKQCAPRVQRAAEAAAKAKAAAQEADDASQATDAVSSNAPYEARVKADADHAVNARDDSVAASRRADQHQSAAQTARQTTITARATARRHQATLAAELKLLDLAEKKARGFADIAVAALKETQAEVAAGQTTKANLAVAKALTARQLASAATTEARRAAGQVRGLTNAIAAQSAISTQAVQDAATANTQAMAEAATAVGKANAALAAARDATAKWQAQVNAKRQSTAATDYFQQANQLHDAAKTDPSDAATAAGRSQTAHGQVSTHDAAAEDHARWASDFAYKAHLAATLAAEQAALAADLAVQARAAADAAAVRAAAAPLSESSAAGARATMTGRHAAQAELAAQQAAVARDEAELARQLADNSAQRAQLEAQKSGSLLDTAKTHFETATARAKLAAESYSQLTDAVHAAKAAADAAAAEAHKPDQAAAAKANKLAAQARSNASILASRVRTAKTDAEHLAALGQTLVGRAEQHAQNATHFRQQAERASGRAQDAANRAVRLRQDAAREKQTAAEPARVESEMELRRAAALVEQERTKAIKILEDEKTLTAEREPREIHFLAPAHIAIRDFGPQGEVHDREGLVIYEDMTFSYKENGEYGLHFKLGTPALPVTLRLRLLFQKETNGPWQTITLEPLEFSVDPENPQRGVETKHVTGHSAALAGLPGGICQLKREGTARFGFASKTWTNGSEGRSPAGYSQNGYREE